jgi:hypothetical protein
MPISVKNNSTEIQKDCENVNNADDVVTKRPPRLNTRILVTSVVWIIGLLILDRILFAVLFKGFDRYFGLDRECQIVFVGNSRTALGIDHRMIEKQLGVTCGKFALNGAATETRSAMLKYLCKSQPHTKTVVLDVSGYSFNDRNLSSGAYTLLYPYIDTESIQSYVAQNAKKFGEVTLRKIFLSSRFNSTTLNLAIRGLLGRDDNLKFSQVNLEQLRHRIAAGKTQSMSVDPDALAAFESALQLLLQNGKNVVLVYLPVVKILNDVDRNQHDTNVARFQKFANDPNVFFLDLNSANEENYEIMFDGIHLNNKGKRQLSRELANILSTL